MLSDVSVAITDSIYTVFLFLFVSALLLLIEVDEISSCERGKIWGRKRRQGDSMKSEQMIRNKCVCNAVLSKKTPMKQILITMFERNSGTGRVMQMEGKKERKKDGRL
jgi:hypothetical protein